MTPAEYVCEIVIPTVEEFRDDRTSRRRAYLAAIVTYQLRDHLAEALTTLTGDAKRDRREVQATADRVDAAVRAALPSGSDAFEVVRGVCNGAKHVTTRSAHTVPFTAGSDWERPPAMAGRMMAGLSQCGDHTGGREIGSGTAGVDLYHAVQMTLIAFITSCPIHLKDCAFEPYPNGT